MDTEVLGTALKELRADGIRHSPNPDLQACTIFDLGGDETPDGPVDIGWRRIGQLRRWLIVPFDDVVDLADVNSRFLSKDIWIAVSDFDNHQSGTFDDGPVPQICSAEIEEAILVHAAGLEDDDVHGINEAAIVVGYLAEIQRHVVAAPGIVLAAVVAGEMQAEPEEVVAFRISFQHGAWPHREAGADLNVGKLHRTGGKSRVKDIWLAERRAVVEPHAGSHEAGSFLG